MENKNHNAKQQQQKQQRKTKLLQKLTRLNFTGHEVKTTDNLEGMNK